MTETYIGIDLGGTNIAAGLCTADGKMLAKRSIKTHRERPYREIAADMAQLARDVAADAGADFDSVKAIGIGAPGSIDSQRGVIVYSNNIRWDDVPLGPILTELTGKPVAITNDANAAALGEARYGAGKKYLSSVLITLGTGVGGGIVLDGKLFEGNKSAGAELGHRVIIENGQQCTCGRKGCWEAYASATALVRSTQNAMEYHRQSSMWQKAGSLERVDGRTAFACAREGDEVAKDVVNQYIQHLAEGIINIINILRPEAVIIGGGVSAEGEYLLAPLRDYVFLRMYGGSDYAPVEILRASLGNDAGIIGAFAFAHDRLEA